MVDLTEISAVVAAVGVLIGVAYYVLDLRHQNKVRQTDLIMRLHSESCSKEMVEAVHMLMETKFSNYEEFVEKYGPVVSSQPVGIAWGMVGSFYEGIGIMVHRKLADVDLIHELFPAQSVWKKMEPLVKGMREQYSVPELMVWFEYLYSELQKRDRQGVKNA